jgi:hypothetical protein
MFALRKDEPVSASRFVEPDRLFAIIEANVRYQPALDGNFLNGPGAIRGVSGHTGT